MIEMSDDDFKGFVTVRRRSRSLLQLSPLSHGAASGESNNRGQTARQAAKAAKLANETSDFGGVGRANAANSAKAVPLKIQHSQSVAEACKSLAVIPPCPAKITERAAVIATSAELARTESNLTARAKYDLASRDDLAAQWSAHVEHVMAVVEYVAHHPVVGLLHRHTVAFVRSPWHRQAIALGWDACALYGVHPDPAAPTVRMSECGLVPHLALGTMRNLRIAAVTADAVTLRASSGMPVNFPRYPIGGDALAPWWVSLNAIVAQPKPKGSQ